MLLPNLLQNVRIFHKTIDFLKVKITKDLYAYFEDSSPIVYNNMTFLDLDLKYYSGLCLFDTFYIINFGKIWTSKHRFDIVDVDKNKVWNIIYAIREYKSNISYIEFSWYFFKSTDTGFIVPSSPLWLASRYNHLDSFLNLLKVGLNDNKLIKRIDYNIDIIGLECFQVLKLLKEDKDYKNSTVFWLTAFDKIKLNQNKGILSHWEVATGYTIKGAYNNLIIYDKILDILENYFKRLSNWVNLYQSYLDSKEPITRIEVQKKWESFYHINDSSLSYFFNNIESLFFDYLIQFFVLDLRNISEVKIPSLNWKSNFLAKKKKGLKFLHSLNMFKAYANNLKLLVWDDGFNKIVLESYPLLQNKTILDYENYIDTSDLFYWIK